MPQIIGMKRIEMYCDIIDDKFKPVLRELDFVETRERKLAEIEIKKSLGITKLEKKKEALEKTLEEIENELDKWTRNKYIGDGEYRSKLDLLVEDKIEESTDLASFSIRRQIKEIKDGIRLSGLSEEVQAIFKGVDRIVADSKAKLLAAKSTLKELPEGVEEED